MGRRYENDREYGYEGRDRYQDRGNERSGQSYRPGIGSSRGSSDYEDERYFGGGRQFGEGYSGGSSMQDSDDRDRGFRGSQSGGQNYRDDQRRSTSRYTGYRGGEDYGSRDYGYGRSGVSDTYSGDYSGGLYGGGMGGYMGGGYQGYNPESYRSTSRSNTGYSSSYPVSESGYYSGRSGRENDRGWWDKTSDEVASWFGDEEAERRREMDQRRGGYRGKGPKGYTRSDERIKEDVSDHLEDHYYLDASDIDLEVNNGDVVLSGSVDSRYAKRLAENLAEQCSGVKNVENRLRVDSDWYTNRSASSGQTTKSPSVTSDSQTRSAANR
jgi:osmotically-inducible protein OsmY